MEGNLVLAGKDRLYMYFRNALPLLRLLEGLIIVFLTPLPRYLQEGCCGADDHAPNRFDEGFEASLWKGLMETRGFFKDFLFTNNLRFKIINPGLCVSLSDASGDPLWGEDPVHPLYGGYDAIIDTFLYEADSLRAGGKRAGDKIAPPAKKKKAEIPRPRWVESQHIPVVITAADRSRVGAGTASTSRCEAGRPAGSAAAAGESEAGGEEATSSRPVRQQSKLNSSICLIFCRHNYFFASYSIKKKL